MFGIKHRKTTKKKGTLGKKMIHLFDFMIKLHKEHTLQIVRSKFIHVNEEHSSIQKMLRRVSKQLKIKQSSIVFCDMVYQEEPEVHGLLPRLMVLTNNQLLTFSNDFKQSKSVLIPNIKDFIHQPKKKMVKLTYQNGVWQEKQLILVTKNNLHLKLFETLEHIHTLHPTVAFRRLTEIEVKSAIHTLFDEFDLDGNFRLDAVELKKLLNDIMKRGSVQLERGAIFSTREVKIVLKSLDVDQNGTVEEDEFVQWVQKGMSADVEERERMAVKTSLTKKLDQFLTAIANEITMTWTNFMKRSTNLRESLL